MSFEALQGDYSMDPVATGPVPTLVNGPEQLQAVPDNLRHAALNSYEGALMVLSAAEQVLNTYEQVAAQEVEALRAPVIRDHAKAKAGAEQKRTTAQQVIDQNYAARSSAADARLQEQVAAADAWAEREHRRINAERDSRVRVATTVHDGDIRAADSVRAVSTRTADEKYQALQEAHELQYQHDKRPIDEREAVDTLYFQLCRNTVAVLSNQVFQTQEELTSAARRLQDVQQQINGQEQRLERLGLEITGLARDTQEAREKWRARQEEFNRLEQENARAQQINDRLLEERREEQSGLQAADINDILGEHDRGEQEIQTSWRDLIRVSDDISEALERINANRSVYEKLKAEYQAVGAWLDGPNGDNAGARGYAYALEQQVGGSVQVLRWLAGKLDTFQDLLRNDATDATGTRRHMINELGELLGEDLFAQVRAYDQSQVADEQVSSDGAAAVDPDLYHASAKAGWFTPGADIRYQEV